MKSYQDNNLGLVKGQKIMIPVEVVNLREFGQDAVRLKLPDGDYYTTKLEHVKEWRAYEEEAKEVVIKPYLTVDLAVSVARDIERGKKPIIPPNIVILGLVDMLQSVIQQIKSISTRALWISEDMDGICQNSILGDEHGSADKEELEEWLKTT